MGTTISTRQPFATPMMSEAANEAALFRVLVWYARSYQWRGLRRSLLTEGEVENAPFVADD